MQRCCKIISEMVKDDIKKKHSNKFYASKS